MENCLFTFLAIIEKKCRYHLNMHIDPQRAYNEWDITAIKSLAMNIVHIILGLTCPLFGHNVLFTYFLTTPYVLWHPDCFESL